MVSLCPTLLVSQAARGLEPSDRNTTRLLASEASLLDAWKVSLMAGRMRPNESLKPLWRTWIMKVATTIDQARHPSLCLDGNFIWSDECQKVTDRKPDISSCLLLKTEKNEKCHHNNLCNIPYE